MPGPCSEPKGGKSKFNRSKPRHTGRNALGRGEHKAGSQNRNKKRRVK